MQSKTSQITESEMRKHRLVVMKHIRMVFRMDLSYKSFSYVESRTSLNLKSLIDLNRAESNWRHLGGEIYVETKIFALKMQVIQVNNS